MDMVGRDDCNNLEGDYTNTVFIVGDDRISTDLHNLIIETDKTLAKPLTLDYEMNDPADPEGVYTRSDHYSYAAKGIPIAFFTTGLHPDYHRVTDTVEKITFPKMTRIAQLMYQSGFGIAEYGQGPRARQQGAAGGIRDADGNHQEVRSQKSEVRSRKSEVTSKRSKNGAPGLQTRGAIRRVGSASSAGPARASGRPRRELRAAFRTCQGTPRRQRGIESLQPVGRLRVADQSRRAAVVSDRRLRRIPVRA